MRKLLLFSCGFTAACLLTVYWLPQKLWLIAGALCLLLFGLLLFFRGIWPGRARCISLGLLIGLLWCWGYDGLYLKPARNQAGRQGQITAQLLEYPEKTDYGFSVKAEVLCGNSTYSTLLYYGEAPDALRPGDVIRGEFTLRPAADGSSDAAGRYRLSKGIHLVGSGKIQRVSRPEHLSIRVLPRLAAHRLSEILRQAAPADVSPFLQAILCGDRSELDAGARHDLTAAGLSHIIAVSGMHVAILMSALVLLLGRNSKLGSLIGIAVLLFFVFLTGASASVVRAAVMLILMLLAPLLKRESDTPTNLGHAALMILACNPWTVADAGFQLSFLAMTGLLLFTKPLYTHFKESRPWKTLLHWKPRTFGPVSFRNWIVGRWEKLVSGVLSTICATIAALSLTLPLTAVIYGTVSTYSLLSNVLVVWVVCICFVGGLLTALCGLAYLPLGRIIGWVIAWPVRFILLVSRKISGLPGAILPVSSVYTVLFLVFAYLVFALILLLREKNYGKPLLCIGGALVLTVIFFRAGGRMEHFSVTALDVGQGQCICLRTEEFSAIVDCGGSNAGKAGTEAADYLNTVGVGRLDALILTHYDVDHVGGVFSLLERVPVDTIYLPDVSFDPDTRSAIETAASRKQVRIVYVTEDLRLPLAEGALTIFAPVSMESDNSASLAVLFTVLDYDTLITGDMDQYAEHCLLQTHDLPDVEALVAGHHGAETSTGGELLRAIRPETVLISVGRNNYGHPSDHVLKRLEKLGADVYTTLDCGQIEIRR